MNWILKVFTDARGNNYYKKRLIFKCILNIWATFLMLVCILLLPVMLIYVPIVMLIVKSEDWSFDNKKVKNIISKVLNK